MADEASLRNQRLDFFKRIAANDCNSHIFLGHHADDAVETSAGDSHDRVPFPANAPNQ